MKGEGGDDQGRDIELYLKIKSYMMEEHFIMHLIYCNHLHCKNIETG